MFTFNVTNEDIENGRASFTLPPSMIDVCSVTSLICGGNDAGNSTKVDIQLPSGMSLWILYSSYIII